MQSVYSIGQLIFIDSIGYRLLGFVPESGVSLRQFPRLYLPVSLYSDEIKRYAYSFEIHDFNQLKIGNIILTSLVQRLMNDPKNTNFYVRDQQSRLQSIYAILKKIKFGLMLSVSVCFLVGGFGISNIMFLSVQSRTREIGVLKAIGATKRFILMQFLMQSMIIAIMGALLGIMVGLLVLLILSMVTVLRFDVSIAGIMLK